jgi:hypothetical protein
MRRRAWHRILAALMALWLVVNTTEPTLLHGCPMHGGGMHAGSAAAPGESHAATSEVHADPAGGGRTAREGNAPAGAVDGSGQEAHRPHQNVCTCLGDCSGGAATPLAGEPPTVLAAVLLGAPIPPGRPEHEYVAAWIDFVLPFATAPPQALPA